MLPSTFDYVHSTSTALFWMFLLQGASFLVLGVLIILYPEVLFALAAALCVWIGLTTLLIAWRVRKFRRELKEFYQLN